MDAKRNGLDHSFKYSTISMAVIPIIFILVFACTGTNHTALPYLVSMTILNTANLIIFRSFHFSKCAIWITASNPIILFESEISAHKAGSAIIVFTMALWVFLHLLLYEYKSISLMLSLLVLLEFYCIIRIYITHMLRTEEIVCAGVAGLCILCLALHSNWELMRQNISLFKEITQIKEAINSFPFYILLLSPDGSIVKYINKSAQTQFKITPGTSTDMFKSIFFANYSELQIPSIKYAKYLTYKYAYSCVELSIMEHSIAIIAFNISDLLNKEEGIISKNMQWLFTSTANHQLRTPLSIIDNMINLLKEEELTPKGKEHLQVTQMSVCNLRHIIDDTLMLKDKNTLVILNKRFSVEELVNNLSMLFAFESKQKNIKFIVNSQKFPFLFGDPDKIFHVLYTLLQNAFKYTYKGSVCLAVSYSDSYLSCSVKDTGIGMNKAEVSSLYKIFSNSEYLRSNDKVGTGIGLYVVSHIVNIMGGILVFKTKLNSGTEFSFKLKMCPVLNSSFSLANLNEPPINSHKFKILIVDDNSMNIFALKSILGKLGFQCDTAFNGKEAVDKHTLNIYDVIFMDINMPIMNGIDATKTICSQKATKSTYIIAVTAQNEPSEVDYKQIGFCNWVTKPVTCAILKKIISELHIH